MAVNVATVAQVVGPFWERMRHRVFSPTRPVESGPIERWKVAGSSGLATCGRVEGGTSSVAASAFAELAEIALPERVVRERGRSPSNLGCVLPRLAASRSQLAHAAADTRAQSEPTPLRGAPGFVSRPARHRPMKRA